MDDIVRDHGQPRAPIGLLSSTLYNPESYFLFLAPTLLLTASIQMIIKYLW